MKTMGCMLEAVAISCLHDQEGGAMASGVFSVDSLGTDISHDVLEKSKLRYDTPDVTHLEPYDLLNEHELAVIAEHLPPDAEVFPEASALQPYLTCWSLTLGL